LTLVDTGPAPESWSQPAVAVLESDGEGDLWFGGFAGLGCVRKDGAIQRWTPRHGFASYAVTALFRDRDGTIWAGTEKGLCHLLRDPSPRRQPSERCYGVPDGLPNPYIQSILRSADGRLWVGTLEGAAYISSSPDDPLRFTSVTRRNGLADDNIEALAEDSGGNLWLGTADDGAVEVSKERIMLFTEQDGLASPNVVGIIEDASGGLCAITRTATSVAINRFDTVRFKATKPSLPASIHFLGRGFQQVALQDSSAAWWIATGNGLLRYTGDARGGLRGKPRVYLRPGGPDGWNVFRVYEDSHGDIWWSTSSRIANTLARWSRVSDRVEFFAEPHGLPPLQSNLPAAFVEDRAGVLWLGFENRGLARHRPDNSFEYFDPAQGFPDGRMRDAFADTRGRLWFASSAGLWRLDDPSLPKPVFRHYSTAEGLSSDTAYSITEDLSGRIYMGTASGVDRIDPESGRVEHLSAPGGLPQVMIQDAYRDRQGNIWFATRHGVVRFAPSPIGGTSPTPEVSITSCRVRGLERALPPRDEMNAAPLSLRPEENQIEFRFVAPCFSFGGNLMYQYRVQGAESSDWSSPSRLQSVNFASLAPGSYTFLVRAVGVQGAPPSPAASVAFQILPPLWATWWFRLGTVILLCAGAYSLYRYRMRIAVEREQLRMRLAGDLHDDIGASLSSIAIWSELALQQARNGSSPLLRPLEQIGAVSREVIDSVSDMVWAINPMNDRFDELSSRMRRYIGELAAADRAISFTVACHGREAAAGPAVRRELFLVLKEALNNALRHSGFSMCEVSLDIHGDWITLHVRDNGKGFDPKVCSAGNGLESMRRRALRVGGTLNIVSTQATGTVVALRVPAVRHTHIFRWR
jgi:ligand-binding sensor domain-containing protein/two-component sensor histidine kinase